MNRKKLFAITLALTVAVLIGFSQLAPSSATHARKMPPGALLYLEAGNFAGLLSEWAGSTAKAEWQSSANYEVFLRTGLLGRLDGASAEFTKASGVAHDWNFISSIAGGQSAMAIYDIGNLKFVYITRLSAAKLAQTKIWQARTGYATRSASGKNYFIKNDTPSHRTACMANDGDLLILTTDESLMAATLSLLSAPAGSLASQPWFNSVWNPAEANSDLRMVYNMNELVKTPHFRSYWIQHNVSQLKPFSAGSSSLVRQAAAWTESRVMLRSEPETIAPASLNSLSNAIPQNAGFIKVWSTPQPDYLATLIGHRILGGRQQAAIPYNTAPSETSIQESGDSADLEARIDDAPLKETSSGFNRDPWLRFFTTNIPKAALSVGGTRPGPDGVFTSTEAAVVIEFNAPINTDDWSATMLDSMEGIHSVSRLGLKWLQRPGYRALDGLLPLFGTTVGNRLILTNSESLITEMLITSTTVALDPTTTYFAQFRHGKERPAFGQLMKMIDVTPTPGALFSENLTSLSSVLRRFDSATVVRRDLGDRIQETVTYRIAP